MNGACAPNLTVYYGVRYSYFPSPYDQNGRLSNFDPALYNPAHAPQVTGAATALPATGNFCNGMIVNSQNFRPARPQFNCTPDCFAVRQVRHRRSEEDFAPRFGIGMGSVRQGQDIGPHRLRHLPRAGLVGTYPAEHRIESAVPGDGNRDYMHRLR